MNQPSAPLPKEHPLMQSWEAYKQTEDFANSKGWAMQIAPIVQHGDPDGEAKRRFDMMPREQRESHVDGALWAAFAAGYDAAHS